MLATFWAKMEQGCGKPPFFLFRCFFEPLFCEIWAHVGSMLLHFGANLVPFWLHFAAILVPTRRYFRPLGRTSLHWMGRLERFEGFQRFEGFEGLKGLKGLKDLMGLKG